MKYIYDYAIMSAVFLIIIVIMYFSKRQFPDRRNKAFSIILICSVIDVLLDIASSIIYENCALLAEWFVYTVNTTFYLLQVGFSALIYIYVIINAKKLAKNIKSVAVFLFPALVVILLFLINPFTHVMFYVNSAGDYIHCAPFVLCYIVLVFYIVLSFITLFNYKKNLTNKQFNTMLSALIIIVIAVGLQYMMPYLLLTSAGMAIAITMMYLIMQKPEDMLDSMTNVFNREAMFMLISDLSESSKVYKMTTVELHNLRRINRIFGMSFGDELLAKLSEQINSVSNEGWVFRFLGNVFVLITIDEDDGLEAYNKIRKSLLETCVVQGVEIKPYTTICAIENTNDIKNANDACNMIETVISEAKRGTASIISVDMMRDMKRRNMVETELMKAIATESFEVYYQPIYSIKSKSFSSVEALVRFSPDNVGSIAPSEFIPIAEKQGVVAEIDSIVLKKVCEFIKTYDPAGKLGIKHFELNLSPAEFINNELSERVMQTVSDNGVDPSYILFEITESTAVSEFDSLHTNIEHLSKYGFKFVLDDYGTGYSNISILMSLPFSTIKLDKSMLTAAMMNPQNRIIFEKTVSMFTQLGMGTVVEGVENDSEADFVIQSKADNIQGYFYAMPMKGDDFIRFMNTEGIMIQ